MCFKRSIIYVFTELSLKIYGSEVVTFNGSLHESIIINDIMLQLLFQYNIILLWIAIYIIIIIIITYAFAREGVQ